MKSEEARGSHPVLFLYEWIVVGGLILLLAYLSVKALNAGDGRWPRCNKRLRPAPASLIVVSVSGEVERPGKYHVPVGITLREILINRAGLTQEAEVSELDLDEAIFKVKKVRVRKKNRKALR